MKVLSSRIEKIDPTTEVRRYFPQREQRMVGAWCFLDQLGPLVFPSNKGMHVGPHPHIGLQTFTWMLEGEVIHRDSLGYEQVIRPLEVNLMTAGKGIAHSEDSVTDGAALHAAQLWIALPKDKRQMAPEFQNYQDLPTLETREATLRVLIGSYGGKTSQVPVHSPLLGLDIQVDEGGPIELQLDQGFEHALVLMSGHAVVEGHPLKAYEWIYAKEGRAKLSIQAEKGAHFLLLGGEPFEESIFVWWNMVSNEQATIEKAIADWNAGLFPPVREGSLGKPIPGPSTEGLRLRPSRPR